MLYIYILVFFITYFMDFNWSMVFIIILITIIIIITITIIIKIIYKNAQPEIQEKLNIPNILNTKTSILVEPFTEINNKNLITSEVLDDESYNHFKQLIKTSKHLCHGKTHNNTPYKVHIALSKDYKTLLTKHHYKILYIHNMHEVIAYIAVKIYKTDGGFMFIHKLCSIGGGYGTILMNTILKEAHDKHTELGITYLSLTTHNLDLIDYYKTFNPTRTEIIDSPGTKRKIPKQVAYMIWQLSPNMPQLNYN